MTRASYWQVCRSRHRQIGWNELVPPGWDAHRGLRDLPADFHADPYPVYDALRARDPVRRMPDGSWFLTRHADLQSVTIPAHSIRPGSNRRLAGEDLPAGALAGQILGDQTKGQGGTQLFSLKRLSSV